MRIPSLPYRLWKALHPFTWLVMLVVALALVIIVVPGEMYFDWETEKAKDIAWAHYALPTIGYPDVAYSHGWPRSAVVRIVRIPPTGSYYPVRSLSTVPYWTKANSWPVAAERWIVNWLNLVLNLIAVALVLVVVGVAVEYWVRRRGGLWRFRVIDLLAALTVGALFLGWYQYHKRIHEKEWQQLTQNSKADWAYSVSRTVTGYRDVETTGFTYCGPEWLRRLAGGEGVVSICNHVRDAQVSTLNHRSAQSNIDQLKNLSYVDFVVLRPWLPRSALETLSRMPRLESLQLGAFFVHKPLEESFVDSGGLVRPWQLDELKCLRLKKLTLTSDDILAEDVERVATAVPTLRRLMLKNVSVAWQELGQLRQQFPHVQIDAMEVFADGTEIPLLLAADDEQIVNAKLRRAKQLEQESTAR